jgi:hypothetical protein
MKSSQHSKALALAAVLGALAVPAVALASPVPDVFDRAVARSKAPLDAIERYAASHPYGGRARQRPAAYRFTTDTLGGNGHVVAAQGYRLTTDTLGGSGRPAAVPSYRFRTDTLGGNGGPGLVAAASGGGFRWRDGGIGAGIAVGTLAFMAACLILARQLRHQPQPA